MIVTADPLGDFNATSQILRYSALAREITVPRIPSVTSTILAASASSGYFGSRGGRMSPTDTERETMEISALEIARMSEEIDGLRSELSSEQERRIELEAHFESLQDSLEEQLLDREADVREECYLELEQKLQQQMRQWKATWAAESDWNDEHLDKKLEIFTRATEVEDENDKENQHVDYQTSMIEAENVVLKRELEILRRQLQQRSPTKQRSGVLKEIGGFGGSIGSMGSQMDRLRVSGESVSSTGSGVKKMRKLPARKWDLGDGDMI